MGPTHAISGAAGWLLAAHTVAATTGNSLNGAALAVSTVVASGAALLPDIDSPTSTVSRVFGWPSVMVSHGVNTVATLVYNATRGPRDEPRTGGHRTLTHTTAAAIALSALVGVLCSVYGESAVVAVLFVTFGLAVRGLMAEWAQKQGWLVSTATSAVAAWTAAQLLPTGGSWWWLGLAITTGAIIHLCGDMITKQGCPMLWPLPIRGKTWFEVSLPGFLRIRAGGWVERALLLPALAGITLIVAMDTWTPQLLTSLVSSG